jgi:chromosome segregation ATPase
MVDRNALALKQGEFVARVHDLEAAIQKSTIEVNEARAGLATHSARADRLERELEDSKRRLAVVTEQLPSLRTEFVAKEKKLQEIEQQRANLEDRYKLSTQEVRSSRNRVEEMVASASKLNRQINELEGRNTDALRRIGELEASLAQETAAHARLKTTHLDDSEAHRLSVTNLKEEINALNVRSEGAERLLAEARAELRERNTTIRAHEQSASETSVMLQTSQQTAADLERTLEATHAKHAETEAARAALEGRAGDLARDLANRTTALKRAEEQVAALEASMAAEVKLAISELEQRDALILKLRADLETQSSARAFAEGALQSARQERVSWRGAQEANASAPNESSRDKLSRLRA